ncbi:MAG: tRNA preQ1(34) S-adenosylmethionine ribosyltransferase-isomerase QueA [Flavobacteriales bacterium]|nr:tRNA preQ1(34) S-adenosylmethionine ribosyltransferase-isomerase QueA [Flavobacteriales bacterium]
MKLSKFKYNLPPELIAQYPSENRDESRMMVVNRKDKTIEHKVFKDILNYFDDGDVMVFNNSKVFPARLYGNKEKTGAQIEVFLLRELNHELRLWDVLVDPARKIRVGNKLFFGDDDLIAEVIDNTTSRGRTIRFLFDGDDDAFKTLIYRLGETPLPKYIERKVEEEDAIRYQTIHAKVEGAIAPPTAGLHFTRETMIRLEIKGVKFSELTVFQGASYGRSVEVEDLTKHKMDSESMSIPAETASMLNGAMDNKKKVCAVGSGAMRAIESSVSAYGKLNPSEQWTDKFIFPPYEFRIANSFLTNFHESESTLMMITAAFIDDMDFFNKIYKTAIAEKYRFLSYGDVMLIL